MNIGFIYSFPLIIAVLLIPFIALSYYKAIKELYKTYAQENDSDIQTYDEIVFLDNNCVNAKNFMLNNDDFIDKIWNYLSGKLIKS